MSDFLRIIAALQQQMNATFSRSDVLRPLHIMFFMLGTLVLGLAGTKAPEWLLTWAAYGLGAVGVVELLAYLFCLFKDRDALRSERYHLQKMAIEHRLLGDEGAGLFEIEQRPPAANQLTPPPRAISAHQGAPIEIEATPKKRAASLRASKQGDVE